MIGTLVNALAILAGGVAGLWAAKEISQDRQVLIKKLLGIFTVWVGLSMTWNGLNGSFKQILWQLIIVILALTLGHATGRWLRLQSYLNRLGQFAKQKMTATPSGPPRPADGFQTCALLFCVAPLGLLGSLQEGLQGNPRALVIKAIMDGLATMAFARTFGWGVLPSAIPVFTCQGSFTLVAQMLAPYLQQHALLDTVTATNGMLIFNVSLVILGLGRIALANYLPSLLFAPLLTWLWP